VFVQDHEDEVNHYVDHHPDNVDEYHMLRKVESFILKHKEGHVSVYIYMVKWEIS
jgi:hypothetical protein